MAIQSIWEDPNCFDRYTVVFDEMWNLGLNTCLGLSNNPEHPQGFSQFCGGEPGSHLGAKISLDELPQHIQDHIKRRIGDD